MYKLINHIIYFIQKCVFHDNPTWNINYSGVDIPGKYSEYLLMVKSIRQKKSEKAEFELSGINKFELTKWN